jgi:hypothetical protein
MEQHASDPTSADRKNIFEGVIHGPPNRLESLRTITIMIAWAKPG